MIAEQPLALLFDMDGTMIDNMGIHNECWQETLRIYGLPLSLEEVKATCHGKNQDIIDRLFEGKFSAEEAKKIADEKEALYRERFANQLTLLEGLEELLKTVQQAGIPMGIGTAAPPENVAFALEHLQIRSYFKAVVDANQVKNGKPAPDVFLKVAELLGVPPERCLVFEDSPTGARAAFHANMKTIILTTTHQPEEFESIETVLGFIPNYRSLSF
jgi:beta-phosphoglucomutase family hydrolase